MLMQLAKPQWQSFFEQLSPLLHAKVVARGIEPELIPVKPSCRAGAIMAAILAR